MPKDETVGVLVVEDDPLVMLSAVDVIEDAGYRVYQAAHADAAIRMLERHDDIRILFTDIEMPGSMDGMALAACIRDRWPPVSIIVTWGAFSHATSCCQRAVSFLPNPMARGN